MRNAEFQSWVSEYLRTCVCQSGGWACPKTAEATSRVPKNRPEISFLRQERDSRQDGISHGITMNIGRNNIIPVCCKKDSKTAGKRILCVQPTVLETVGC